MNPESIIPRTYNVKEVQKLTKYCESTIRHGLSEGRWTSYKIGKKILIDASEIDNMILAGRRPAAHLSAAE